MKLHTVEIVANEKLTDDAFLLTTTRLFDFEPGQSVAITTSDDLPPRLYSICSGTRQNAISLLYKVVENGRLTPRLAALNPGDQLFMSDPLGSFIHGKEQGFWIASGTGIAPFISMLESGVLKPHTLLFGARTSADVYFSERLHRFLGEGFLPCVTKEKEESQFNGRLTTWLKQTRTLPLHLKYYLCGSPEMVVEARDILIDKGVEFRRIASEIYF